MNDNLLQISLNHGKHFKKKINKIKEGFVSLEQEQIIRPSYNNYVPVLKNMKQNTNYTNNVNEQDLNELKQLQSKYNDLTQQYTNIQQKISDSSLVSINRLSTNNPYLNKTIRFTTGQICYVTNQGIAKYIPSLEILNSTNAPKNYIDVNLPWDNSYSIEGTTIPTDPPLISGSFITMGQNVGNEGLNVYVNSLLSNDISPTYVGCYATNLNNDNMTFIGNKPLLTNQILIKNGNFEQPVLTNNSYTYINNNNTVPNWNFNAVLLNNSGAWNYPMPYPKGKQCVSLQKTHNIQQDIQLDVNYTYTLTFYSCGRNCCTTSNSGNPVKVDLLVISENNDNKLISNIYNFTPPVNKWTYYSINFKVSSTQLYTIFFSGQTTDVDKSSAIQAINISVDNNSVGDYTYDDCKTSAIENGYQYFALQNVNTTTSKGFCAVSNSEPAIKQYGEGLVVSKQIPLWQSNTAEQPGNIAILNNTGSLSVINSDGKSIYSSPSLTKNPSPSNYLGCYNDSPSRTLPTYLGDNTTYETCQSIAKKNNFSLFGLQYTQPNGTSQCWGGNDITLATSLGKNNCDKSNNVIVGGGWTNAIYNTDTPETNYFLILEDDGNMSVYKGTGPNDNQGSIWSTMTNGKQQSANPNIDILKSKYGKNWIASGSTLGPGDFISSNDGKLVLMMQPDGNLVLYTYKLDTNCKTINNNKIGGGEGANAVYNIGQTAIPQNMGLLGYINSDSKLMEYPDSMVGFTNDYQIFQNTNVQGYDIDYFNIKNPNECQAKCNANLECGAYVYDSQNCWLKNKNAYSKGKKSYNNNVSLGVRNPKLKESTLCSNKIVDINTNQYENYKKGAKMTPNTQCNNSIVSQNDIIAFDNIKSQLITLGEEIISKTENLYNQDNKIFEKLNTNEKQFKQNLKNYKLTNFKIKQELNLQNNNIEGMQNQQNININDINGMLTDSDLRVLQENYNYIMWSIFAVGIITITINTMKK
jgi:hypothetical protein